MLKRCCSLSCQLIHPEARRNYAYNIRFTSLTVTYNIIIFSFDSFWLELNMVTEVFQVTCILARKDWMPWLLTLNGWWQKWRRIRWRCWIKNLQMRSGDFIWSLTPRAERYLRFFHMMGLFSFFLSLTMKATFQLFEITVVRVFNLFLEYLRPTYTNESIFFLF